MRSISEYRLLLEMLGVGIIVLMLMTMLGGGPPPRGERAQWCVTEEHWVGQFSFDPNDRSLQRLSKYVETRTFDVFVCDDYVTLFVPVTGDK